MIPLPFNPADVCTPAELNGEGGFPHSEIVGSQVAHTSPTLIAACHVLHRLYMPRHPRIALTSRLRVHTTNDNTGLAYANTKLGRAVLRGIVGADVNLSLVSDGTSSSPPKARKPRYVPSRRHHGIDLKNPFTMSKNEGRPWGNPALHVKRGDPMSSSLGCMVEPIGIEPMT